MVEAVVEAKEVKALVRKTKEYKLIGSKHSGFDKDGNAKDFKTGDKVPLTENEAKAFADKFEGINDNEDNPGLAKGEILTSAEQPATADQNQLIPAPEAPETKPQGTQQGSKSSNVEKVAGDGDASKSTTSAGSAVSSTQHGAAGGTVKPAGSDVKKV